MRGTPEYREYVKKVVDQAPPLSEAKKAAIRAQFADVRIERRERGAA